MRDEVPVVPLLRFGRLLREHRLRAEQTIEQLSAESGLPALLLEDVETGRRDLSDERIHQVSNAYGIAPGELVPQRSELIVDPAEEWLATGGQRLEMDASTPDRALVRYLALIYALRGIDAGTPIPIRDADLDTLAGALLLERTEIDDRLRSLMSSEDTSGATSRMRVRRRWLFPAAGVLVGAAVVGSLVLINGDDPSGNASGREGPEDGAPTSTAVGPVELDALTDPSGGAEAINLDVELGAAVSQERTSLADQPPTRPVD